MGTLRFLGEGWDSESRDSSGSFGFGNSEVPRGVFGIENPEIFGEVWDSESRDSSGSFGIENSEVPWRGLGLRIPRFLGDIWGSAPQLRCGHSLSGRVGFGALGYTEGSWKGGNLWALGQPGNRSGRQIKTESKSEGN